MISHTRAMIVAVAYAFIIEKKVGGLYDHAAGKHLRIAAESRGDSLQGYDGDRSVRFGGTLPEIYDAGDETFVSMTIDGHKAQGFDRGSASSYTVECTDLLAQLYDHRAGTWFAFSVHVA